MNERILDEAVDFVKRLFREEYSGHDFYHTYRVFRMAQRLAEEEGAQLLTVQLAALLHDVDDRKLSPDTCLTHARAKTFLREQGVEEKQIGQILQIIEEVSFRGTDSVVPSTLEGKCVQDADRLDAIGAIGIARCFAYGGSHHRLIHDPESPPGLNMDAAAYYQNESTSINHFYEKLLLLSNSMTTPSGKRIAAERHRYLQGFLDEFLKEWEGKR